MLLSKETSLFKVDGVKDKVSDASKVATNYITTIDSNGIRVHATNNTTSNYARVNANGLQVYKGSNEVASFGDEVVIGKTNDKHAHITSGGFYVYSGTEAEATKIAQLGYGSGQTSSGGTASKPYSTLGVRSTTTGRTTVGNYSVAEGYDNYASGYTSHAEGEHCDATGHWSHAEGKECKANALNAHAGGWLAESLHQGGFAHGFGVKTNQDWQTVLGKYNVIENGALLIGSGSSSTRNTIFKVDWSGNVTAGGGITANGQVVGTYTPITPTITASTGSVASNNIIKAGNLIQLNVSVTNSSAVSVGSNIFVGSLESTYRPHVTAYGCGYYGSTAGVAQLQTDGTLTLRCTGANLSANSQIYFSITYVL